MDATIPTMAIEPRLCSTCVKRNAGTMTGSITIPPNVISSAMSAEKSNPLRKKIQVKEAPAIESPLDDQLMEDQPADDEATPATD